MLYPLLNFFFFFVSCSIKYSLLVFLLFFSSKQKHQLLPYSLASLGRLATQHPYRPTTMTTDDRSQPLLWQEKRERERDLRFWDRKGGRKYKLLFKKWSKGTGVMSHDYFL